MNEAIIIAIVMSSASILGQIFTFANGIIKSRNEELANVNKPKMDLAQAQKESATAAEAVGRAWDQLYAELREIVDRQGENINRQDRIISQQDETIKSLTAEIERITSDMNKVTSENMTLKLENSQLKDRVFTLERELETLKAQK